jgi:hypothetical protein
MRLVLMLVLCLGCAKATTTAGPGADASEGGSGGGGDGTGGKMAEGPGRDGAPATNPDARSAEDAGGIPGFIPPSLRDGGIPRTPPGTPPCAPDSNAGNGNTCPYKAIVACSVVPEAGPVQACTCLGALSGKWICETARDGGGVVGY